MIALKLTDLQGRDTMLKSEAQLHLSLVGYRLEYWLTDLCMLHFEWAADRIELAEWVHFVLQNCIVFVEDSQRQSIHKI